MSKSQSKGVFKRDVPLFEAMNLSFNLNFERKYLTKNSRNAGSSLMIADLQQNNIQLLDEAEQNIVIYQWRADQLFADAEGRGK